MTDINSVVLVGRLVKDSEIKYLKSGTPLLNFTLASNKSKKVNDKWEDEVSFFDCVLYGKQADNLFKLLLKGKLVSIQGSLEQQRWESNGDKRSRVKIIVDKVQLLEKIEKSNQANQFDDDIPY